MAVWSLAFAAQADEPKDEVRQAAERYLDALAGKGNQDDRELLLGGATSNAQLFNLENWKVVSRSPPQAEQGDLRTAVAMMQDLDKAGRLSLSRIINSGRGGEGLQVHQISEAEAKKILEPTREKAQALLKASPVLAYIARVDKDVYWHPKNPIRALLASAGGTGNYMLQLHIFNIETKEGPRQVPRQWPLRVLRFRAGKLDTGWKVLPASDWNAE
ncbi:MAG TPA: hypothetical protein VIG99_13495 [Myxococcaceae bacterium]|jgi:hypothetical protein